MQSSETHKKPDKRINGRPLTRTPTDLVPPSTKKPKRQSENDKSPLQVQDQSGKPKERKVVVRESKPVISVDRSVPEALEKKFQEISRSLKDYDGQIRKKETKIGELQREMGGYDSSSNYSLVSVFEDSGKAPKYVDGKTILQSKQSEIATLEKSVTELKREKKAKREEMQLAKELKKIRSDIQNNGRTATREALARRIEEVKKTTQEHRKSVDETAAVKFKMSAKEAQTLEAILNMF